MKQIELKVSTNVVDENGKAVLDENGKNKKDSWTIPCTEFEATDISITVTPEVAAKGVKPENILKDFNRQYQTDAANESRRERTSGGPKRVATDKMIEVLMGFGLTKEQAEAKIAEANKR